MTPTNEDLLALAKIICAAMNGPSEYGWDDQSDLYRADLSDALLREAAEALGMAVDDLDEWVACGDSLAQAGFNMDGTADCAERARATLAKLRAHLDGRADEGGVPNGI